MDFCPCGGPPQIPSIPGRSIKELAEETMKTFSPNYVKAFGVELVKEMQRERDGDEMPHLELQTLPAPSAPLKQGWLTIPKRKLKCIKTSDSKYYILSNAKNNYVLYWYPGEQEELDPDKAKSGINLCEYRCTDYLDYEEKHKYGENAIKLYPLTASDERKTYYFDIENDEDRWEWEDELRYAGRMADPPMNPDPVLERAFKQAFEKTRLEVQVWSHFSFVLTESQMLTKMIVDRCDRELMYDIYNKLQGNRWEENLTKKVRASLGSLVKSVVNPGWAVASKAVEKAKPSTKEKAESQIGTILDKRQEIKEKAADKISEKAKPIAESIVPPTVQPLVEAMVTPLMEGQKKAIEKFREEVENCLNQESYEDDIERIIRRCRYSYGILREAFKCLHPLTRYDSEANVGGYTLAVPVDTILEKLGDVSMSKVEADLENIIRDLVRNAAYTYGHQIREGSQQHGRANLDDVTKKLIHDCKVMGKRGLSLMLYDVVGVRVINEVMPVLEEVLDPFKELIPETLEKLLDVDEVARSIIDKIIMDFIETALAPKTDEAYKELDKLSP
eukprot:gb/GECG01000963.1/.p1 GENE.gb/GECG01000963.1/~~gb/GECG01000963.1/.p1  ORF type:complete len:560 (+),score=78.40 gb/GECG01000963.1/:1-1680(+)